MNQQHKTGFIIFALALVLIGLNYLDPVVALNNFIFIGLNSAGAFINQTALTFLTEFGNAAVLLILSLIHI